MYERNIVMTAQEVADMVWDVCVLYRGYITLDEVIMIEWDAELNIFSVTMDMVEWLAEDEYEVVQILSRMTEFAV